MPPNLKNTPYTNSCLSFFRYGRYGTPKPQICLVDAPVAESTGTVKSLVPPGAQSVALQDDDGAKKERSNVSASPKSDFVTSPFLFEQFEIPTTSKSRSAEIIEPAEHDVTSHKSRRSLAREDVVMLDEDTRMSADFRGKGEYRRWKSAGFRSGISRI